MVTSIQTRMALRGYFPDASVDPTDARNSNGRIDDAPALCSDGSRRASLAE
jgi:hypothetical protein